MVSRLVTVLAVLAIAAMTAAPAQAAPRRESRLFFVSNRTGAWEIYSISRAGTGFAQLTVEGGFATAPGSIVPSPDGRFVLVGGSWVLRTDGSNGGRLTRVSGSSSRGVWAPDSRRVALDTGSGIVVLDIKTRRSRLVFRAGTAPIGWSRDGSVIYAHVYQGCDRACPLIALTLATGVERRMVDNAYDPVLSPDRRSIAYVTTRFRGDVHVVDVRTAGDRVVAADVDFGFAGWLDSLLRWSPNGRQLALVDGRAADSLGFLSRGILVVDTSSGALRTVTDDPVVRAVPAFAPAIWTPPAWSPNGDAIAYVGLGGIRIATLSGHVRTVFDTARDGAEVADLAWARTPPMKRPRQPARTQALLETAPNELRLRAGVPDEIAADGDRLAFLSCGNPGVWTPATQVVTWTGPNPCPRALPSTWNLGSLALSDVGTAFVAWSGGGNSQSFSLVLARPGRVASEALGGGYLCCTGGRRWGTEVGAALGSGPLLVFSGWEVDCPTFGDPSCATSSGRQSVWRVRERGLPGTCPYASSTFTGPCSELASSLGPIAPLSADERHVVLLREGGRVDVVDGDGALLRSFGFAPGEATAAEVDGGDIVVTVPGLLLHYSVETGVLLHSWPLPRVSSGGFCGAPVRSQCAAVRLRLEDLHGGLAAYLLDGSLHVMRLRDGADRVIDRATAARFGETGLFYARDGEAPWPGRVRFLRLDAVAPL